MTQRKNTVCAPAWKVMIIDDDPHIHASTKLGFENISFETRNIHFYSSFSAEEGKKLLQEHKDIAVVLLDLTMESDSADLDFVHYIRQELKNRLIRIILYTERTKQAPILTTVIEYDINGYKEKSMLTAEQLYAVIIAALRSYGDLILLDSDRQRAILELSSAQLQFEKKIQDLERMNQTLKHLAFLDGLTGIANRRYFDDFLEKEWRRAQRLSSPVALLMLDLDFFKSYNDTYGHQAGDDCLKAVASAIKNMLKRTTDLVARFGGEEFVIVLPHTDIEGATVLAERLKNGIEALGIRHEQSKISAFVTASIGVAAIVPRLRSIMSEIIATADQALYEAKQKGRNQISIAQRSTEESHKPLFIKSNKTIVFGINPFLSHQFIWENYVPILKEVAHNIGFEAHISIVSDYDALGHSLLNKTIDVGWFSPLSYVLTKTMGKIIPLVTPIVNQQSSYIAYIIARKDRGFQSIEDLQGKHFGFVDPQSSSGYLYPRQLLLEQGIDPTTFFSDSVFLGNHQRVISGVLEGVIDAGAIYSDALVDAALRGFPLDEIVILAKSSPIPKDVIATRGNLNKELVNKLKKSFISFASSNSPHSAIMKKITINGFIEARDDAYDGIRKAAQLGNSKFQSEANPLKRT